MTYLYSATAVSLFFASLALGESHIFDVTQTGQTAESNGFLISGGCSYVSKRSPAVTFGVVRPPGGTRTFTYVVLSRFDGRGLKMPSVKCDLAVHGSEATDRSALEGGGKKLALVCTVRLDHGVIAEELTANGKKVDLGKGRVLLVNFSKEELTWSQAKADLPAPPGDPEKPDSLSSVANDLVQQLRKDNASVRDFLK